MAASDFIVAIELGSSKITGIAGKKLPDGSIQVLAFANEHSADCIRKGVIYNLDKTTQCLSSIIKKLESTLKASIGKVYVGIGGQSLHTIRHTESLHLEEPAKISREMIDQLMDNNRNEPIVGFEILDVVPQEYKVGLDMVVDPIGVQTDRLEARFLNIIARNSVKQNIIQCFEQANIEIAEDGEDLISPLILADTVLNENEKRSGCALVDFGAETTTVQIYKNNLLRHLAVIPLGGKNITNDICSQQLEEEDAEELKVRFAKAYTDTSEEIAEDKTYKLENKSCINALSLEDIVEARLNEIIDNVANQIVLSGYDGKLMAGVILTGGAAKINNMEEAFIKRTKINKVRMTKDISVMTKGLELPKGEDFNTLLGLLAAGKENCCLVAPEGVHVEETEQSGQSQIESQLFGGSHPGQNAESLEEQKRQKEKEAALAANKAMKEKAEQEKQRSLDCETLIQEAVELKNSKEYKKALKKLEKARAMNIASKEEAITALERDIDALKKETSLKTKVTRILSSLLDED